MSPSTTDLQAPCGQWPRAATLVAVLIASSCRFGGPSGDPTVLVVDGAAGTAGQAGNGGQAGSSGNAGEAGTGGNAGNSGQGGLAGSGGTAGSTSTGGSAGAIADAGSDVADDATRDGGSDSDAGRFDGRADADAASDGEPPDGGTPCAPPFSSAVCDPVCNVGCTALLRCDITDTPRTGVCVGTLLSTVTEGMPCTRTAVTDECAERLSCLQGICRRLCYRDTDCTTSGTCCNTAIDVDAGPSGYRICTPCGP